MRKPLIHEAHDFNILVEKREIFLHSHFENEDNGIEYRVANNFLKNIRFLESISDKPIIVHQHSIGGDFYEGMMIFDAIKQSKCYITIVMHGQACSMGSLIPQAADLRVIMPNCLFMTHRGSISIDSFTIKQADSFSNAEKHYRTVMLSIYAKRCINGQFFLENKYSEKRVQQYLIHKWNTYEDWYLNPDEAVYYGFCDKVLENTIEELK